MMLANRLNIVLMVFVTLILFAPTKEYAQQIIDASKYNSLQEAIDSNPYRMVFVPQGEYKINTALKITTDGSGLYGYAKIIQENSDEHIIEIRNAENVKIDDLTLTRSEVVFDKDFQAVTMDSCNNVWLRDLKILNNRAKTATVLIRNSNYTRIEGCEIINYKTITVDDRMKSDLYRYAFNAIDGHGLMMIDCNSSHIIRNRIIEHELHPTKEIRDKYELGKIVNRAEELGELAKYGVENNFVVIWHQGAGMRVTGATETQFTLIDGNYIKNVAQGIDLHTDHVIVTNNHVINSYMGMKAMHGSRNVLISNNIFQAPGKYGLLLRPGSASRYAQKAVNNKPAVEANYERGIIVSNNIFSDVGFGSEHWRLWNEDSTLSYPVVIKLGYGPLEKNPPLSDVIFQGNIIYDKGLDRVLIDGEPQVVPPKYKYAVWFDEKLKNERIHFHNNIFNAGAFGVSNKELKK